MDPKAQMEIAQLVYNMMDNDLSAANQWLSTPLEVLNGNSPLEHLKTENGLFDVQQLIRTYQGGSAR